MVLLRSMFMALIFVMSAGTARADIEITDFFLDGCDTVFLNQKLSLMKPGFKALRLKDLFDADIRNFDFVHPEKRYLMRTSIGFLPDLTPIIECAASNMDPAEDQLQILRPEAALAILAPRARFGYSQSEIDALLAGAHDVLRHEFDYDPEVAKALAVNGTTHYYEGCLGGREVTVTLGSLFGNWFITAKSMMFDRGRFQISS